MQPLKGVRASINLGRAGLYLFVVRQVELPGNTAARTGIYHLEQLHVVWAYKHTRQLVYSVPVGCANTINVLMEAFGAEPYPRSALDPAGIDTQFQHQAITIASHR
ncbi:hypothetical protein D3C79_841840 [compost metagenome]